MITINKKNSAINVTKFTLAFILLPLLVLFASFRNENKVYNTDLVALGQRDTLVSAMTAKFKTVKTLGAYLELVQDKNEIIHPIPVNFLPLDPDETTPSPIPVTGSSGSVRAKTEIKAYLDSLIIDQKSPGLLKNAKQ
jgi:hypothetical protein